MSVTANTQNATQEKSSPVLSALILTAISIIVGTFFLHQILFNQNFTGGEPGIITTMLLVGSGLWTVISMLIGQIKEPEHFAIAFIGVIISCVCLSHIILHSDAVPHWTLANNSVNIIDFLLLIFAFLVGTCMLLVAYYQAQENFHKK